ncbi:MAG: hypothetical protein WC745_00560 [Patescibacteria group bacterium]|jgi:hypothetical protein
MNKKILKIAKIELKELSKRYDGLINVVLDDWRGYRFIFDTKDVRNCKNNCLNCNLYKAVNNEKKGKFEPGLYLANGKDKKMFGPQNFLNCKTLSQYQNCYAFFLVKVANTKNEIKNEICLIRNLKLIYAKRGGNLPKAENKFKKRIFRQALSLCSERKRCLLTGMLKPKEYS